MRSGKLAPPDPSGARWIENFDLYLEDGVQPVTLIYARHTENFGELDWCTLLAGTFDLTKLVDVALTEAAVKGGAVIVRVSRIPGEIEEFQYPPEFTPLGFGPVSDEIPEKE